MQLSLKGLGVWDWLGTGVWPQKKEGGLYSKGCNELEIFVQIESEKAVMHI